MGLIKTKIPPEHYHLVEQMAQHYLEPYSVETKEYENGLVMVLYLSVNGLPATTQVSYYDLVFAILPKLIFKGKNREKHLIEYFRYYAIEIAAENELTMSAAFLYDFFLKDLNKSQDTVINID